MLIFCKHNIQTTLMLPRIKKTGMYVSHSFPIKTQRQAVHVLPRPFQFCWLRPSVMQSDNGSFQYKNCITIATGQILIQIPGLGNMSLTDRWRRRNVLLSIQSWLIMKLIKHKKNEEFSLALPLVSVGTSITEAEESRKLEAPSHWAGMVAVQLVLQKTVPGWKDTMRLAPMLEGYWWVLSLRKVPIYLVPKA